MTANPRQTGIPPAPTWLNPRGKAHFSALIDLEIGWKGYVLDAEVERIADLVDMRCRIEAMRKRMRSESSRKGENSATVVALSKEINATTAAAHQIETDLRIADKQKARKEREDRS